MEHSIDEEEQKAAMGDRDRPWQLFALPHLHA
jgi:hypothetical protein